MRLSRTGALILGAALLLGAGVAAGASQRPASVSFGAGTPTFTVSAAPAGLPSADLAGEPSLGADWQTGALLYQSYTSTYRLRLTPRGHSLSIAWQDASSPYSLLNLDPILATDHATGATLAGGDDGTCSTMSLTHNDGEGWTPSLPCSGTVDHPTVGFGPFASPKPAGASGERAAYFCQRELINECARSLDGGATWSPAVPVTDCLSLFGHLKVAPDGTVYVPSRDCNLLSASIGGFRSTDNGLTWQTFTIAGTVNNGFDPSVAVADDGRLYESWTGGNNHPFLASSADRGSTWSTPLDLATVGRSGLVAGTFESVVAGDHGRVAVAYLGTQVGNPAADPFSSGFHGVWHLFVATSYDTGKTWNTVQVTHDPVQRGEIDGGGTTTSGQRNLLDFMDATLTQDGRVAVGFADGCIGACAQPSGTEAQSASDNYATVAVQTTGRGLFARYDSH